MKCLVILTGVFAVAVVAIAALQGNSDSQTPPLPAGYCDRESHNKTVIMDAFRRNVTLNITDAAYIHHLECESCTGCHGEKYYGNHGDVVWAKQPCNGTFVVVYKKDNKRSIKTIHLDASRHDVRTSLFSGASIDTVHCQNCQGCQGAFGLREAHFGDTAGTRITRKQVWAKSPCQGKFKVDYLKAHCTKITLKGDETVHARHISVPCKNGNIFRLEPLPGMTEGNCELGKDVYFHKDLIFYGNCTGDFEVCEVAPYEDIDHSDHAKSDKDKKIDEYWSNKLQHRYRISNNRHHEE